MISLILTVLNEGDSIRPLLDSLLRQTRPPDEIVVVDGGSRDHTVAILQEYTDRLPLRVVVEPGANISQGRNRAIREAQGDLIVVTDAGVTLSPDWLEAITSPFSGGIALTPNPSPSPQRSSGGEGRSDRPLDHSRASAAAQPHPPAPSPSDGEGEQRDALGEISVDVVGGFFQADPHSAFEAALGAATLPLVGEIDPESFLPSSRSIAFRRAAWAQVGGYPEWLDYCEDLIFDLRLKQAGLAFAFAPHAVAYFRPRATPRAFYRQYFLYARGDGKADLWRKRHAIRYATYLVGVPLLLALMARHGTRAWGIFGLLAGAAVYLRRPYQRLPAVMTEAERLSPDFAPWVRVLAWIPMLRALGDFAKMLGYLVGWRWRLRNSPPRWRS